MSTFVVEAPFSGTLRRLVAEGRRPACEPNNCVVGMLLNVNAAIVDDVHPLLKQSQWPDEQTRKSVPAGSTYVQFRHCSECGNCVCEFHGIEPDNLAESEKRLSALFKGDGK